MKKTIKFQKPIPFSQIRFAIKKMVDNYLQTSNLDHFSKLLWDNLLKEFYQKSSPTKVVFNHPKLIKNRKYRMYRDYYYSDLGFRDFVLVDVGLAGRLLLHDGKNNNIVADIAQEDVFIGIQYEISDNYKISENEKSEWIKKIELIVSYILKELGENPLEGIGFSNSLFLIYSFITCGILGIY